MQVTALFLLVVASVAYATITPTWRDPESPEFVRYHVPHPLEEEFHRNTRGGSCFSCSCPSKFAAPVYDETVTTISSAYRTAIDYTTCLVSCYIPNHPGGIRVTVTAVPNNPSSPVLASASPNFAVYTIFPPDNLRLDVPCALDPSLCPSPNDINVFIDPTLETTLFYMDCDGLGPNNRYDFVSVMLHELVHGLGFSDYASDDNSNYGSHLNEMTRRVTTSSGNRPWIQVPLPSVSAADAAVISDDLFYTGIGYTDGKLYAPNPYEPGSSISHWDEDTYTLTDPNILMTPAIANAEVIHSFGPLTCDLLLSLGYPMDETLCGYTLSSLIPPNDDCSNAVSLVHGSNIVASNAVANSDTSDISTSCSGQGVYAKNVWYTFNSRNAQTVIISVCNPLTDFDSIILLYDGDCGSLTCTSYNDDAVTPCTGTLASASDVASTLSASVAPFTTYYVSVASYSPVYYGQFQLTLTLSNPNNNLCSAPISLVDGVVTSGLNAGSTGDRTTNVQSDCPTPTGTGNDVWYSFNSGQHTTATITTCNPLTTVDTILNVYEGTGCGALDCLGGNDDDNTCSSTTQSTVTVTVTPQTVYFVLVAAKTVDGNFNLLLSLSGSAATPPPNDMCASATPFTGSGLLGTLSAATDDLSSNVATSCLQPGTTENVWYTFFTGSNDRVFISTCNPVTGIDTLLSVYSGSCGSLVCRGQAGGPCPTSLSLNVNPQATYYVLVTGNSVGMTGTFFLDISLSVSPPANDDCSNALVLSDGSRVVGTVLGATDDLIAQVVPVGTCGSESANNVWYSFSSGSSTVADISLCDPSTNFDTKLFLFRGGSCGSLACDASNDDYVACASGTTSSYISAPVVPSSVYYVLVSGKTAGDNGAFAISLNLHTAGVGGDPYVSLLDGGKYKIPQAFDEKVLCLYRDNELFVNVQSALQWDVVSVITRIATSFVDPIDSSVRHTLEAVVENTQPVFYLDQQRIDIFSENLPSWLEIGEPIQRNSGILTEFSRYQTVSLQARDLFTIVGGHYNHNNRAFGFFNIQVLKFDAGHSPRHETGLIQLRREIRSADEIDYSTFVRPSMWE